MKGFWAHSFSSRLASIGGAGHLLICSDYDGTLAPIALRPEHAQMLPDALNLLNQLALLPQTRVAIVSGRSLEELRNHTKIVPPVLLVGSHGAELPGHVQGAPDELKRMHLEKIESAISSMCESAPGVWIERKPFGLAVHVRQASEIDASRVLQELRETFKAWPFIYQTEGKSVLELSLARSNKGDAINALRGDWGTDPQVIYLGDDVTDEAAFGVLEPTDLGIKVGRGNTRATYRVSSEEVAVKVLSFLLRRRSLMSHSNQ